MFGQEVNLSTTFRPQMDGQERTIKTLMDILRACVINFKGNWDDYLPLIDFVYTRVTVQASKWLHMKHFMGEDAHLLLDGLKLVSQG